MGGWGRLGAGAEARAEAGAGAGVPTFACAGSRPPQDEMPANKRAQRPALTAPHHEPRSGPRRPCRAVGRVLRDNAPVMSALDAFEALHQSMAALSAILQQAAGGGSSSGNSGLESDSLAFNTAASILFTLYSKVGCGPLSWACCQAALRCALAVQRFGAPPSPANTSCIQAQGPRPPLPPFATRAISPQMRRLLAQLPAALAREQPGSADAVLQRLSALPPSQAAPPKQPAQPPQQQQQQEQQDAGTAGAAGATAAAAGGPDMGWPSGKAEGPQLQGATTQAWDLLKGPLAERAARALAEDGEGALRCCDSLSAAQREQLLDRRAPQPLWPAGVSYGGRNPAGGSENKYPSASTWFYLAFSACFLRWSAFRGGGPGRLWVHPQGSRAGAGALESCVSVPCALIPQPALPTPPRTGCARRAAAA